MLLSSKQGKSSGKEQKIVIIKNVVLALCQVPLGIIPHSILTNHPLQMILRQWLKNFPGWISDILMRPLYDLQVQQQ